MTRVNILFCIFLFLLVVPLFSDINQELFTAARQGAVEEMEDALASGASINDENILGETALLYAIDECQTEAARLLVDRGARLDYLTKLGYTPLMKAAVEGCSEIARLLIDEGVNVNHAEPKKNMNPLLKATQFNRLEIIRILVENGADIDFVDKFGNTALMIASQKGHVDLAEYLIEQNADVNAETLIGYTPLLYALEFGQPEIAEILIENGADVNVIDKYNRSTLIHAAARGYSELVETLINMGVDPDIKTENEETAAVIAQQHEFDDIVDFLVDSGADTTGLVFVDSAAVAEAELIAEMYDTPPEPVGGLEAVQKKLRYPKDAEEAGLEGTVTVRVTVDRRGRVSDTEVVESFGDEDCDTAAQRAVRGTRWKAAQKDNKRVEAWVDIPVEFTLEE